MKRSELREYERQYASLDLLAHRVLDGVPIHDVWRIDLEGPPAVRAGLTMAEVRPLLAVESLASGNAAARALFRLRGWLGGIFGWDSAEPAAATERPGSYRGRVPAAERAASLVPPGTMEGPFEALVVTPHEAISEIRNATVHAFAVFALVESEAGYSLYWAIYVEPVGAITRWYMRLIDPFRRAIVYPAAITQLKRSWRREFAG